ncbi:MAG TPA: basic amino acid ABC transporter substrate-binding protein [Methanomassiliicoccales archaeon]|nr:basic amino acid ABC transporter substrate-binding protein [Methanomassiliicoccales archaeon]
MLGKKGALKVFGIILVAAMISTAFIGCLGASGSAVDKIKNRGTLIVGTSSGFVPFEQFNATSGQVEGFDIDIANAIAKRLGVTVTIRDMGFEALVGAAVTGTVDIVAAGMTISDARNQSVLFSEPYYGPANQAIIVANTTTDISSPADLNGKRIAVNTATTGDFFVSDPSNVPNPANILRYPFAFTAIQVLKAGGADAVVIDSPTAAAFVKQTTGIKVVYTIVTNEYYGIAMRKSATDLRDTINSVINDLKSSGQYDQLIAKWFG